MLVVVLYDQPVDVHFPAHYRQVYLERLRENDVHAVLLGTAIEPSLAPAAKFRLSGHFIRKRRVRRGILSAVAKELGLLGWLIALLLRMRSLLHANVYLVHDDVAMATVAYIASRVGGGAFIYRVSHLKPETVALEGRATSRGLARIARQGRNFLLRRAEHVIAMSDSMGEYLVDTAGVRRDRLSVVPSMVAIPPAADGSTSSAVSALRQRLLAAGGGCRWMVYSGNLNPARELSFLFDVLSQLRSRHVDIRLLVLGVAQRPGHLEALETAAGDSGVLEFVEFHPPIIESELPHALQLADVGLSPFPLNAVFVHNSPVKTLDYLNAGIPVVGTAVPDQVLVIEETGGGVVAPYTAEGFADAIENLLARGRLDMHSVQDWLRRYRSIDRATYEVLGAIEAAVRERSR